MILYAKSNKKGKGEKMICQNCKQETPEGQFCANCGAQLTPNINPSAQPVQPIQSQAQPSTPPTAAIAPEQFSSSIQQQKSDTISKNANIAFGLSFAVLAMGIFGIGILWVALLSFYTIGSAVPALKTSQRGRAIATIVISSIGLAISAILLVLAISSIVSR